MICGSLERYDGLVAKYVESTGVPFLSIDYRLSPEFPGTTLVDDSFAALEWFIERADEFGVDPRRVALMGDSGGGGVAAGVAIAARDAGHRCRTPDSDLPHARRPQRRADPEIAPFATWTYDNNFTGWSALLGERLGTDGVSPSSSPARVTDFRDLSPAFIDVGELDIFRDESIAYAAGLLNAGVSVELHVRPGVPHAFDRLAPTSGVGQRSWERSVPSHPVPLTIACAGHRRRRTPDRRCDTLRDSTAKGCRGTHDSAAQGSRRRAEHRSTRCPQGGTRSDGARRLLRGHRR